MGTQAQCWLHSSLNDICRVYETRQLKGAVRGTGRRPHFSLTIISVTVELWVEVLWVISVYFNIRNTLPKSGTFLLGHPVYCERSYLEYIVRSFILFWGHFYHTSNLIGGSIKLPSETLHDTLPVLFVEIKFGGSPAQFQHALQIRTFSGLIAWKYPTECKV